MWLAGALGWRTTVWMVCAFRAKFATWIGNQMMNRPSKGEEKHAEYAPNLHGNDRNDDDEPFSKRERRANMENMATKTE